MLRAFHGTGSVMGAVPPLHALLRFITLPSTVTRLRSLRRRNASVPSSSRLALTRNEETEAMSPALGLVSTASPVAGIVGHLWSAKSRSAVSDQTTAEPAPQPPLSSFPVTLSDCGPSAEP